MTKRTGHYAEEYRHAGAALSVGRRGHAQAFVAALIKAAGGAIADREDGVSDARAIADLLFEVLKPQAGSVLARRNSGGCLEATLQMKGADVKMLAQLLQAGRARMVLLEISADSSNQVGSLPTAVSNHLTILPPPTPLTKS